MKRYSRAIAAFSMLALFTTGIVLGQSRVTGVVTDFETGDPLPGANVLIQGTTLGAATNADGTYAIDGVANGSYNLVASFVGYESETRVIVIRGGNTTVNFQLVFESAALEALEVFASRAIDRETPVAATTVDKVQIQQELGSRDIPLVLDTAPSVYATAQGGGAGDARINVRGFNQRNVAVMINGVPVNDMENGWVYWSNWDGVGDAASSIQLQRGLSAVNLATPSIGGTLNIVTDPALNRQGGMIKQEVGRGGFFKTTAMASSGLVNGKYGVTVAGVRKFGDGFIDGTFTDSWAYYGAATYNINSRNRLDLFAFGAPQRHGQNLYRQNIGSYDREFAESLDTYDPAAFSKYNEAGRFFNQNWAPVSNYDAEAAVGDNMVSRYDNGILWERENFYHKPQVNLNWYYQLSDRSLLSTVAYYSGGYGGGTGTLGSSVVREGFGGQSPWFNNAPYTIDWDAVIARNQGNADGSRTILRNSRNNQWTVGAISKFKYEVSEPLSVEFGLDWRTAEIEHYREVRDLLGGDYFRCNGSNRCGSSDFWNGDDEVRAAGDKIDYDFTNTVDWFGAFAQGEYKADGVSAYGMAGLSTIKYGYTNFFVDGGDGSPLTSESDNIMGVQLKGGGLAAISDEVDLYANLGYVSKVPIFDGVIDDRAGITNQDPENEKFYSIEVGAYWNPDPILSAKLNIYSTRWEDRTFTRGVQLSDGSEGLINLRGLDALHQGIEVEAAYQPFTKARLDVGASFGDWRYTNDVSGSYRPDARVDAVQVFNFFIDDLRVGDAPQTQMAFGVTLFPTNGLDVQATVKHYANHFSDFDPFSRTSATDRRQSWEAPNYQLVDLHVNYDLPKTNLPVDIQLFAHVFNLLDEIYIQDALDNSRFNSWDGDHDADDAEVFLGLPRSFNIGTRVTF
ncbi:MAG: TonB-dependent receptor [Rhodothermales bacterium]|nr:TonB-dependent receptor [Rhodothermales bacterium]MBO6778603.1 TonB-dependent receptor [Rhodothermales bacterium]